MPRIVDSWLLIEWNCEAGEDSHVWCLHQIHTSVSPFMIPAVWCPLTLTTILSVFNLFTWVLASEPGRSMTIWRVDFHTDDESQCLKPTSLSQTAVLDLTDFLSAIVKNIQKMKLQPVLFLFVDLLTSDSRLCLIESVCVSVCVSVCLFVRPSWKA